MVESTHDTAPPPAASRPNSDRLDSWKEIAAYLNRDVTTVQRWEKREGMPVPRHLHDSKGSVYASRAELDSWVRGRNLRVAQQNGNDFTLGDTPYSRRLVHPRSHTQTMHSLQVTYMETGYTGISRVKIAYVVRAVSLISQ